jgi:hypothetical protein
MTTKAQAENVGTAGGFLVPDSFARSVIFEMPVKMRTGILEPAEQLQFRAGPLSSVIALGCCSCGPYHQSLILALILPFGERLYGRIAALFDWDQGGIA